MPIIRRAGPDDADFLEQVLVLAACWRPGTPARPVADVMNDPAIARYIERWPRVGDVGFVATAPDPVGAAWWRHFPAEAPGYGFVDDTTPEVSIGVVAGRRGCGIGTLLLEALTTEARAQRIGRLSLSVETDNPAVALYRRFGFVEVGRVGGAYTMVLEIV